MGSVQWAKFKGMITITGIAGRLQQLKRHWCLCSSRTRCIGMSKLVEWEVALTGSKVHSPSNPFHRAMSFEKYCYKTLY